MRSRKKQWLGFLVMVVGLGLLLGPFIQGEIETYFQEQKVAQLHEAFASRNSAPAVTANTVTAEPKGSPTAASTDVPGAETAPVALTEMPADAPIAATTADPAADDPFFQAAMAYNQKLQDKGQYGMDFLADLERFDLDATKFGYSDNIVGTISVPRVGVEVPLYLGATGDHMASGFAVMGMTSVPLGLGDENVAIAAHRGWRGAPMLRDVQMILVGDPIIVTTPWRTLTYIVSGIEIVTPTSTSWAKLHPGRTMISLMTCHPYGQHTHRYIVYADLQEEQPDAVVTEAAPKTTAVPAGEESAEGETPEVTSVPQATQPAMQEITLVHEDGTRETILIDATAQAPDDREYSTEWSNTLIQVENSMRPVAYAAAVFVAAMGLWLTIATIRDKRHSKRGE